MSVIKLKTGVGNNMMWGKKIISIHVNAKFFGESNTFYERMQKSIEIIIILIFPHHVSIQICFHDSTNVKWYKHLV